MNGAARRRERVAPQRMPPARAIARKLLSSAAFLGSKTADALIR
ncbi:hypothetical protein C7S16_0562 [Burkholderia thailandensis]|uniref:Uncharacterized protein n=1 Tax=Burkholderia thailandensis TaxID=57975 RepID=A0AAW9D5I7_BURTH|nr:hypothetical protein [Burkholderia thailandensis]